MGNIERSSLRCRLGATKFYRGSRVKGISPFTIASFCALGVLKVRTRFTTTVDLWSNHRSIRVQKAEQFLRTARLTNTFAGGAFDFISVCPPYLLVDYNELFDLLEASPLVRPYPKPDDHSHAVQ